MQCNVRLMAFTAEPLNRIGSCNVFKADSFKWTFSSTLFAHCLERKFLNFQSGSTTEKRARIVFISLLILLLELSSASLTSMGLFVFTCSQHALEHLKSRNFYSSSKMKRAQVTIKLSEEIASKLCKELQNLVKLIQRHFASEFRWLGSYFCCWNFIVIQTREMSFFPWQTLRFHCFTVHFFPRPGEFVLRQREIFANEKIKPELHKTTEAT